jgi:hypothetical protein
VENTALLKMRNQTIKIMSFKKRKNLFYTRKAGSHNFIPKEEKVGSQAKKAVGFLIRKTEYLIYLNLKILK